MNQNGIGKKSNPGPPNKNQMEYKLGLGGEKISDRVSPIFTGVAMIRGEYLCKQKRQYITVPEFQKYVYDYISNIAQVFAPDDVWYRTIELTTEGINRLEGLDYALDERQPDFGLRGIRRGLRYPETFLKELGLISELSKKYRNVHLLIPFVHDIGELQAIERLLKKVDYRNKVGIMAEIPSTILCLEDFCEWGIDNITVGINDLTTFTLGTSRNSDIYNKTHPAVIKLMKRAVEIGRKYGVETGLAGYLNQEIHDIAKEMRFNFLAVFYHEIPLLFGENFADLPEVDTFCKIKGWR
nr:hypothetical protein [Nanoarchaeum sp.]